jgi:hypothetical protein
MEDLSLGKKWKHGNIMKQADVPIVSPGYDFFPCHYHRIYVIARILKKG